MNQYKGHTILEHIRKKVKSWHNTKNKKTVVRQMTPRQKKKKRNFLSICLSMAYICSNLF
jgi:hypothetical protein